MTAPTPPRHRPTLLDLGFAHPSTWFQNPAASGVWVSVHRMAMLPQSALPARPTAIDLGNVRALMHWGTVQYTDGGKAAMRLQSDYTVHFDASGFTATESIDGAWLALITPHKVDGTSVGETEARHAVASALGLLSVVLGENVAYEQLTEGEVDLGTKHVGMYSQVFRSPHALPPPDLSGAALSLATRVSRASNDLPADECHRVNLALRWYTEGVRDDGVDGFLKIWIALEVLAMPDTTHIGRLNALLASAYTTSATDAAQRFMVGRLFGLRSNIVHKGRTPPIHNALNRYLQALFADVLFEYLGLPTRASANHWLVRTDVSISTLLAQALAV